MKIKKILIIMITIIICICSNFSYATFNIDKADLYSKGKCKTLLINKPTGGDIVVTKIFYKHNGVEYPAYCLNVKAGGVEKYGDYQVSINSAVENELVWAVIVNGYPYQSLETLGVLDEDEAYVATKQAVYCILYGYDENDFEKYIPKGEAGERTLNAMKQIVKKARSQHTRPSNIIKISENGEWQIDNINKDYISKKFKVNAECDIKDYEIEIEDNGEKDIKITDLNGKEIRKTTSKEFKVLVPLTLLKESGDFKIKINGQLATKPILFGNAGDDNKQSYALAGEIYEGGSGSIKVDYQRNKSKLKIHKKDKTTGEELEGVKFHILDENNKEIYYNLETDKNGEIIIEGILPGKYYLEEIEGTDGYKKLEDKIEFQIDLNEEIELVVTNEKEPTEIVKEKIKKLPVTGK